MIKQDFRPLFEQWMGAYRLTKEQIDNEKRWRMGQFSNNEIRWMENIGLFIHYLRNIKKFLNLSGGVKLVYLPWDNERIIY